MYQAGKRPHKSPLYIQKRRCMSHQHDDKWLHFHMYTETHIAFHKTHYRICFGRNLLCNRDHMNTFHQSRSSMPCFDNGMFCYTEHHTYPGHKMHRSIALENQENSYIHQLRYHNLHHCGTCISPCIFDRRCLPSILPRSKYHYIPVDTRTPLSKGRKSHHVHTCTAPDTELQMCYRGKLLKHNKYKIMQGIQIIIAVR